MGKPIYISCVNLSLSLSLSFINGFYFLLKVFSSLNVDQKMIENTQKELSN
jgi:FtsH-binding integral membrane protein